MSSQYDKKWEASKCIDKRMSAITNIYMCHSADNPIDPWLKITFSYPTKVDKVQIFNRNDGSDECAARVDNAEITLWKEGSKILSCGTITYIPISTFPSQSYLVDCGSDQEADTVQIQLPGQEFLNLNEVFVLTKTPPARVASCSTASASDSFCTLPKTGLKDGDVITFLLFYAKEGPFNIRLLDEEGTDSLYYYFKNYIQSIQTYQYVVNSRAANGKWGVEIKQSGALLENMMVEVEIKLTATHYQTKINGEALPGKVLHFDSC